MDYHERRSPARLRARAWAAFAIGMVGVIAVSFGILQYQAEGVVRVFPSGTGVGGREAIGILVGVGVTAVGFCLYASVLRWSARRIEMNGSDPNG